jgi:hypothetical protein
MFPVYQKLNFCQQGLTFLRFSPTDTSTESGTESLSMLFPWRLFFIEVAVRVYLQKDYGVVVNIFIDSSPVARNINAPFPTRVPFKTLENSADLNRP